MHIVYSAFTENSDVDAQTTLPECIAGNQGYLLRLLAHQQVCEQYAAEIAAIRKYLPQWQPKFN